VAVWDLTTGQESATLPLITPPLVLKFGPNGDFFASSQVHTGRCLVAVHSVHNGATRAEHTYTNRVTDLGWHPAGRWLGVPDHDSGVHLMDPVTGESHLLGHHRSDAVVVEFSPDGRYLLSGGWDRQIICWDVRAMRRALGIALDSYRFQFSADGRRCATVQWPEGRIQLHTFEPPAFHREFPEDLGGHRNYAAFSPDGRWLAASGAGARFVVWDLLEGEGGSGTTHRKYGEARFSFAPNGELFVGDGTRWQIQPATATNGLRLQRLKMVRPEGYFSLSIASNLVVFTGARGTKVVPWDQLGSDTGTWKPTVTGWNNLSPDRRLLAIYRPFQQHLYIHRFPDLERVAKLTNEARISEIEFSPLGNEVAVGSRAGVEFWDTTTWQRTRRLTNFGDILYSQDAETFWLSKRATGSAVLCDARTAEPLLPLPVNTLPLALSPDGRQLAVSVDARHMQVWDLTEIRQRLAELGLDWER
jgi:WD40 repeat protein